MTLKINKIYCGDCVEQMKKIDDNSIDLVVTSPPYNCGIHYDVWNDHMLWENYIKWCKQWLREIYRVLKPDGRICLNVLLEMGINNNKKRVSPFASFKRLFNKVGLKYFGVAVWTDHHRGRHTAWGSWLSASSPYIYCPYEVIMLGYKKQWKKSKKGKSTITKEEFIMGCSGIWKLRTQSEITKANFHTDLPDMCLKLLSYEGDLVLDPFMGSGQTAISCVNLKRNYIGIEISDNYVNVAQKRIKEVKNVERTN